MPLNPGYRKRIPGCLAKIPVIAHVIFLSA
jgi:hypothetical protein